MTLHCGAVWTYNYAESSRQTQSFRHVLIALPFFFKILTNIMISQLDENKAPSTRCCNAVKSVIPKTQTGAPVFVSEMSTAPLIESLKASRHKSMQTIVNDDALFQELKKRMRNTKMVTNLGVTVALHRSILDSMLPEVECKLSKQGK
jgi:hypothetical protein